MADLIPLTDAERAQIQADHEAFMTSTVRLGTAIDWEYVDGAEVRQVQQVYYEGKAKIQSADRAAPVVQAGAQEITPAQIVVAIPAAVTVAEPGHAMEVLTSPDLALVGKTLTVQSVAVNDFLSACLLACTLNQG